MHYFKFKLIWKSIPFLLLAFSSFPAIAQSAQKTEPAGLFQVSTLDALLQGVYNGSISVGELKRHGDFGLGTYEGLDGEMIVFDGHFYHMRSNGILTEASDTDMVPFVALTHFRPEVQYTIASGSMADISNLLDTLLPSRNYFYAIDRSRKTGLRPVRATALESLLNGHKTNDAVPAPWTPVGLVGDILIA